MKKLWILAGCVTLFLLMAAPACADSVQGSWSGSARAKGRSIGISCYFNGSGGFSASGGGMSVSGSYSASASSVTLSARGTSISMSIRTSGNTQSMSGSGRYHGIKGSLYLSRSISGSAAAAASSPYAEWAAEADGVEYRVKFYEGGYVYWSELDTAQTEAKAFSALMQGFAEGAFADMEGVLNAIADSCAPVEYVAEGKAKDGAFTVTALGESHPACWDAFPAEDGAGWKLEYKLKDGKLLLMRTEGEKDTAKYLLTMNRVEGTAAKPDEEIFRPYVTLERGDKGDYVKAMQERLIALELLSGKADGDFGPLTEAAVKAYQELNGLEVTGKADPAALTALMLVEVKKEEAA